MSDLHAFAHDWYSAVIATRFATAGDRAEATIEERIEPLVTRHEPYHSVVIGDLLLLLQLPLLAGFGLRIRAREAVEAPFEHWARSIAPFVFDLAWQDTMDVASDESMATSELARIGFEDGAWRVVAIFGERERAEAHQLVAHLA